MIFGPMRKQINKAVMAAPAARKDIYLITLKYNLLPKIIPQIKSITINDAISGTRINSFSHNYVFII